jgi:transposase
MMTKARRQYSREFKREAVRLLETSGKSASELERELGIGKGNLWRWKREFAADGEDAFPGHGRLTPEQERLRWLERENEVLRQERDILKKAVAIFSRPSPSR